MMDIHEAANLFPLNEASLPDLAADISQNGLRFPVELCEGKILDGRRRWRACEMVGIKPETIEVHPTDPIAYVLSLNLHRRHLTPSQLGMVAARARSIYDRQARERMQTRKGDQPGASVENFPPLEQSKARDAAGKAVGVSGKTVDFATKVLAKGVPELIAAVDEGRIAVSSAAVLAHEPPDEQREQAKKATRIYKPNQGAGNKPKEVRHLVANGEVYDGLRYAGMAIEQLKRIKQDDPNRDEAFSRVQKWINRNHPTRGPMT